MRVFVRLVGLVLLFSGTAALAQTVPPQRPFSQLIDVWTRQLDRIGYRISQPDVLPAEIDGLREQVADMRALASAAVALARNDLADIRKLLAPLEVKLGPDQPGAAPGQPAETEAVKAERTRLTEQATISEGRIKQGEVIVARTDQLLDRMTRLRGEVMLQTLLHRGPSPLSSVVWAKLGPQLAAAASSLSSGVAIWSRDGLRSLSSGKQDLSPLAIWAVVTIGLWWAGRALRQRFGRGDSAAPGQRHRTIAAAIDGVGLVLVPILAVWLISKLLAASEPPPPIDALLPRLTEQIINLLLVFGLTATALAPNRPAWRVLPFSDASAAYQSTALRRLMTASIIVDFIYVALLRGSNDGDAINSVGALILAITVAGFALPALSNRAWEGIRPEGSTLPTMVGGTGWSLARLVLSVIMLSSIVFALFGYSVLASHLHAALATTGLMIAVALTLHRLIADLLDAMAAPDTPTGVWVRRQLGLPPDKTLYGQLVLLLLADVILVILLAIAIPAAWDADTDAILRGFGQVFHGVRIGSVTISLANIGMAIVAFGVCMLIARLVRSIVLNRVMPTVDAPLPLRQSIDAGLNYVGVTIAVLIGIAALGIDFTNLAIVLGALSVGIGLGLQNIANNVISGVILLMERPIKAGDWISVNGHEGFVRRINIRATEIETFQRTHVIVPNSLFLQNPVINRTYSDTSSRVDIPITVGLGTDVAKMEAILRESALAQPRVLRVPAPIVRFLRVTTTGLDFELFVFVAQLEDRQIVANELNRVLLARLIDEKILDPRPVAEFRLRDLDKIADVLHAESPNTDRRTDHAAAPPTR